MTDLYRELAERALAGEAPDVARCEWILDSPEVELLPLLHAAYEPRRRHFGRKVMVHVLNNVQNGLCPEDCGYCAQNRDSDAAIRKYPMKGDEAILTEAENAARAGASRYCMVLSGRGPSLERARRLAELVREIKTRFPIEVCVSAGLLGDEHARILADAGLDRLNHNLNTSESHYGDICSTHTYADRVATLEAAKRHGIESCSGLIVGMGEASCDVVEVAFRLRALQVASIPVNFLIPIEGNQVMDDGSLTPERCLRALCLVRLVNPSSELRVAGGREGHLRSLQPLALYPANSLFVDGYLTTRGDATAETYRMIADAGFEVEGNDLSDGTVATEAETTPGGIGGFRLRGGDGELLKPTFDAETEAAADAAASKSGLDAIADAELALIRERGTHRRMRVLDGVQAPRMQVDGRDVLLFAGSNYLDLAHHEEVVEASARAARDLGCASGGSRLITGNLSLHEAFEAELAEFFGSEAALAFNTGYMANVGAIPALVGRGDVIVSDALNHASIVDGARLSRAEVRVFPHGDLAVLEQTLRRAAGEARRVLLAIDGVYSMDGDLAPVSEMVSLAKRWGALVLLDDAHGTGTLGTAGRGTAEHLGVSDGIDIHMGTLGKSLGSFGAFVVGSAKLRELLVNVARSFIFSCALAPPQVAAARAALRLVSREPWRRFRLQSNAARLRERLAQRGVSTAPSSTHIVPVVIGDNAATMAACEALLARGFYAQGIRHPSVPQGTARLRITPMATHEPSEIDALAEAVVECIGPARTSA